ncbi:MAG: hypothetical protein Q4D52_04230 [Eubacteriales bacterium]|nr:hypothetical protein [Eubacteriales bacterium]
MRYSESGEEGQMQQGIVSRAIRRRTVEKEIHSEQKAYRHPLVSRARLLSHERALIDLFEEVQGAMLEKRAAVRVVTVALSIPTASTETELRIWMRRIEAALERYQWKLADIQVRAEAGLTETYVALSASGDIFAQDGFARRSSAQGDFTQGEPNPGGRNDQAAMPIVYLLGYPGSAGAAEIYNELCRSEEADFHGSRYIADELDRIGTQRWGQQLSAYLRQKAAKGDEQVITLGEGGIFSAIYRLDQSVTAGLLIDLTAVPVTPATVALCEREEIDPYRLWSIGSYLIMTTGTAAIEAWAVDQELPLTKIGQITTEEGHCLKRVRSVSSIEKPTMDELYRWKEEKR